MMRHDRVTLHHGDCLEVLRTLPDASVDSVVTDPPYGLGFMGKAWDDLPPGEEWARECLRVLKPGGHLLAFGGTRTWHRLACAVEDAGFEVRDSIAWLYGSGFPKSLDVSKAIDKAAGAEREVVGPHPWAHVKGDGSAITTDTYDGGAAGRRGSLDITAPATPDAERWQGWGTALKPSFEPVVVARKPLVGTVAGNVLAHGTGALNIDGCRIEGPPRTTHADGHRSTGSGDGWGMGAYEATVPAGRWPANVVLDESQADALDQMSGIRPGMASQNMHTTKPKFQGGVNLSGSMAQPTGRVEGYNDTGGASRFFFVTREDSPWKTDVPAGMNDGRTSMHSDQSASIAPALDSSQRFMYAAKAPKSERPRTDDGTAHPTVKPLALMRWLVRLVTPPGGTVLEPFAGSGTTVEACLLEGFQCIAIEREADYLPLIEARIARQLDAQEQAEPDLFDLLGEATA